MQLNDVWSGAYIRLYALECVFTNKVASTVQRRILIYLSILLSVCVYVRLSALFVCLAASLYEQAANLFVLSMIFSYAAANAFEVLSLDYH